MSDGTRTVFEGLVHPRSDWEDHEAEYLETPDGGIIWPAYVLQPFIGRRVRVTIEVVERPERQTRVALR